MTDQQRMCRIGRELQETYRSAKRRLACHVRSSARATVAAQVKQERLEDLENKENRARRAVLLHRDDCRICQDAVQHALIA